MARQLNRVREKPTQERLHELFHYDPLTGVFVWRVARGGVRAGSVAGGPDTCGYLQMRFCGTKSSCHRLAWLYVYGVLPDHELDHINGIKTDNRIENLRPATRANNMCNIGVRKNSKTGVKGVSWDAQHGKFRAQIMHGGKKHNIGRFDTAEAASAAYAQKARSLHGSFANSA
ncbi:HNH endonuclease [Pseudomonas asturiensis]|uniref:HNH endonuclease n=1 Tax=Pseudomonas asturiensis TaxID=1190415 RepID=A0ABX6HCL2_9PSED|nr:HNH endonuclease [Pseudomonas asturiensis]QHF03322.1 HNH endonuclease [Pseudomonas asturiensis]